jgi:branched-chain amino acid transport system substrate-binding protein
MNARIETWDGKKWVVHPEYISADEQIIKPMVKAGADKYLADKKLQRRPASDCGSDSTH